MPFYNAPLLPVAIAYMCGIVFSRYFYIPWWLCIFLGALNIFVKKESYRKIIFYVCIFIIGYLFYQLSIQYHFSFKLDFAKDNIRRIIHYNVPCGDERNLFDALLIGERYMLSKGILEVFRNTNTMHVLSISGLHITFVGVMLMNVFRLMFIPKKASALLAILFVLIYVNMVGWESPAFRSFVMFCVFAMGWIIERPSNHINALSLAALIILVLNPKEVFRPGFQLSFIIVFGLLLSTPFIKGSYLAKAVLSSLTAFVSSLPLTAYYFKVISPVSIIANLIIVPGINLVITLGFVSIAFGIIYLGMSGIFNAANYFLAELLIKFLELISKIPYGYFQIQNFPLTLVFLCYTVIGLGFFFILRKRSFMVKY